MSVFTALLSGVNGINSNGEAVSIIGDNIANVNTHGFKSSRPEFEDIMAGTSSVSGLGSRLQGSTTAHSQGGFESTSVVTDMAIDGDGFFSVRDVSDNSTYYTRAGQFNVDNDGYIVNSSGQRLQGFGVDTSGNVSSVSDDIQLSYEPVSPKATTKITMKANLNANATAIGGGFVLANPITTSNFSVGTTVYDSLGNDRLVTTYFTKTAANSWEWNSVVAAADHATAATTVCAAGTLTFSASGAQTAFAQTTNDFDFAGATANQTITFDFGTTTGTGTGLDGLTQFGADSSINDLSQDGYKSGNLTTIEIANDGTITGNYTNGRTSTLGQIALSTFANEQGLKRVGGNNYQATLESGEALVDAAASGGRGTLLSQTLEQSNVDLANELIKMVIIQRGFQANSRTISVVNELLGSLVSLGA